MGGEMQSVGSMPSVGAGRGYYGSYAEPAKSTSILDNVDNSLSDNRRNASVGSRSATDYNRALSNWSTMMANYDEQSFMQQYQTNDFFRKQTDTFLSAINERDSQNTVPAFREGRRQEISGIQAEMMETMQREGPDGVANLVAHSAYELKTAGDKARQTMQPLENDANNRAANILTAFYEMSPENQKQIISAMDSIDYETGEKMSPDEQLTKISAHNYFNDADGVRFGRASDYAKELLMQDVVQQPSITRLDETAVDKYIKDMKGFGPDMSREEAAEKLMDGQNKARNMIDKLQEAGLVQAGIVETQTGARYQYIAKQPETQQAIMIRDAVVYNPAIRTREQVAHLNIGGNKAPNFPTSLTNNAKSFQATQYANNGSDYQMC